MRRLKGVRWGRLFLVAAVVLTPLMLLIGFSRDNAGYEDPWLIGLYFLVAAIIQIYFFFFDRKD